MRLTLDWDREQDKQEHIDNLPQISASFGQQQLDPDDDDDKGLPLPFWKLYVSSSGDGYHYEEHGLRADVAQTFKLRSVHGDDSKRLRLDKKRWGLGSPFLNVLYDIKYLERKDSPPFSTGQRVRLKDSNQKIVGPEERIKKDGDLIYGKIIRLLVDLDRTRFGTQTELAEHLGVPRSTLGGWYRREVNPKKSPKYGDTSKGPLKLARRAARANGIGHYEDDKSLDEVNSVTVTYAEDIDSELRRRRLFVEYAQVPWSEDYEQTMDNINEDGDTEYALTNIHTGSYNDNHTTEQLKKVHDEIAKYVIEDILSPDNPRNELPDVNFVRESDSINYENKLLDKDEVQAYVDNLPNQHKTSPEMDVGNQIMFEVIVWQDNDMRSMYWHVIGLWNESVDDATVLVDSNGWW